MADPPHEEDPPPTVFRRWADVSAALAHPALVIAPGAASASPPPSDHLALGERAEGLRTLAQALAAALPTGREVDLMSSYAAPWARAVAAAVLEVDPARLPDLLPHSEVLFLAAAHAGGPETGAGVSGAATALARLLPARLLAVQSFVALAHTLPHALCGAWLVLLEHPQEQARLVADPALLPAALEELLRVAGPSRAVYRVALEDVTIGETRIPRGATVRLELGEANRDPARFREPDRYHPDRAEGLHLAFGRGRHACAGAQLIRQAAAMATGVLLSRGPLRPAGAPAWLEGAAIRAPASLPAIVTTAGSAPPPAPAAPSPRHA